VQQHGLAVRSDDATLESFARPTVQLPKDAGAAVGLRLLLGAVERAGVRTS
jgi:hypothetical protein